MRNDLSALEKRGPYRPKHVTKEDEHFWNMVYERDLEASQIRIEDQLSAIEALELVISGRKELPSHSEAESRETEDDAKLSQDSGVRAKEEGKNSFLHQWWDRVHARSGS